MSLMDHEARAMVIKLLSREELQRLHGVESRRNCYLLPHEVAAGSAQVRKLGGSIKAAWGIPDAPESQQRHAERVRVTITELMRRHECHVDLSSEESRCNFDWHVHNADIDLSYQGGRRSAERRVAEEDVF